MISNFFSMLLHLSFIPVIVLVLFFIVYSVSVEKLCGPLMGLQKENQRGMVLKGTADFGEVFLGENRVQVLVLRFVAS